MTSIFLLIYTLKNSRLKVKGIDFGLIEPQLYFMSTIFRKIAISPCRDVKRFLLISLFGILPWECVSDVVTPHRAFYEMSLGIADQKANVQSAIGRSAFSVTRDCDGWLSTEDYVLEFSGQGGVSNRIISQFESWESDTEDKYSFNLVEQKTFEKNFDFSGYADMTKEGGFAYFSIDDGVTVPLPHDTLFPMQHLKAILGHANAGKKIFAAPVFSGAEPNDALLSTNTVIGGWNKKSASSLLGDLSTGGYWPIQVAYFKPEAKVSEPEYEINYSLQPNGIIRRYEIDYGDFTLVSNLLKIDTIERPDCGRK